MGENVVQGQVKSFKKGKDRSLQAMAAATLFDRPEILRTTYTAQPMNGITSASGDILDAYVMPDGKSMKLAKGHQFAGLIAGDGATSLLDILQKPGSPKALRMKVKEVSVISGFIKLEIELGENYGAN